MHHGTSLEPQRWQGAVWTDPARRERPHVLQLVAQLTTRDGAVEHQLVDKRRHRLRPRRHRKVLGRQPDADGGLARGSGGGEPDAAATRRRRALVLGERDELTRRAARQMRRKRVEELARDEADLRLVDEDGEVPRRVVRVQLATRLQEAVCGVLLAGCRGRVVNVGAQLPHRLLAAHALQLPLRHLFHKLGDFVKGREL